MRQLRYELLEWAVGVFCMVIGATMLIVPHQFDNPSYRMLTPALAIWGSLFSVAGSVLLTTAVFKPRLRFVIIAHLLAGTLLLALGLGFAQVRALSGVIHYSVLGVGTLLAPFLAHRNPKTEQATDIFGVVMSLAAAITGLTNFLFTDQYGTTAAGSIGSLIPNFGFAVFLTGLFALVAQLWSRAAKPVYSFELILLGMVYLLWFFQLVLPTHALTGYAYYGGLGLALIFSPWLQKQVYNLQNDSLRMRFALVIALLIIAPLLLLSFLTTENEGDAAITQALAYQQNIATSQSQYVAALVNMYKSITNAFAAQPGLLQMSHEQLVHLVQTLKRAHPDIMLFAVRDGSNNLVVRSDNVTQVPKQTLSDSVFDELRSTNQPIMRVAPGLVYHRIFFIFGAPIDDENGHFAGYVIVSVDSGHLGALLNQASVANGSAYLVDDHGHVIVHPDDTLVQTSADLSQLPPVAKFLSAEDGAGSISYIPSGGTRMLAGYARVPGLGWGVVVEHPASSTLSAVQSAREISLLLLVAVCGCALLIGTLLVRSLTAPLSNVSNAIERLAFNSSQEALPTSGFAETRVLINAFNDLRERLAMRTAERDAAEKRLVFLAEATNALNASLDYEQTLKTIARLAVPTIGDWCTIDIVDANHVLQQIAVVHSDPETEALVAQWRAKELQKPHEVALGRDVMETGEGVLIPEIPAELIEKVVNDDEASLKLLKALNLISALCVPLAVRGERIGVIFLNTSRESGRRLGNDDLRLLTELARRASTAIDNAKLYGEAQNAIQIRDEFLSVAAHELKTPVTSIRGFAQATLRQFELAETPDIPRLQISLSRIDQQSEKLGRLVSQLLDVSRLIGGKLAIEPQEVELVSLIKSVVLNSLSNTQRHRIEVSGLAAYRVVADPLRIEQVITNLVDNAIKYSPDGGSIQISIYKEQDNSICISVTDQGIGVPEAERPYIFNRFFQAHRESFYGGMGLGLYISRQIVELHGGPLEAEYPPEGGTRFTISLPTPGVM